MSQPLAADHSGIAGHPRGLTTLFFTEMWERFSYYGMRALLVLFMTAPLAGVNPGLGFDVGQSTAIYGLYTSMVYLLSLPGGWVADRIWGQRKAVFVGGCIIAAGHFSMAVPALPTFYLGLTLITLGTGLLKPNVSTMVADLYPEGGARRDAGFSIFYMGINLGAFLGTILCGFIGEGYSFHWGFSLAGIGMVLGLVQYKLGAARLGEAGLLKGNDPPEAISRRSRTFFTTVAGVGAAVALFAYLAISGAIAVTIQVVAAWLGSGILVLSGLFFVYLFVAAGLSTTEKKRLWVIVWLYLLAAMFWSGFEQAGSSMNLFARDLTDRVIFDWEMPASWLQNINPHLHRDLRADLRLAVDVACETEREPFDGGEVRARFIRTIGRLFCDLVGGGAGQCGERGFDVVAGCHLLPAHGRRAVPLPGRIILYDQAGAERPGRADDGGVVYRRGFGEPHRRPRRRPPRATCAE